MPGAFPARPLEAISMTTAPRTFVGSFGPVAGSVEVSSSPTDTGEQPRRGGSHPKLKQAFAGPRSSRQERPALTALPLVRPNSHQNDEPFGRRLRRLEVAGESPSASARVRLSDRAALLLNDRRHLPYPLEHTPEGAAAIRARRRSRLRERLTVGISRARRRAATRTRRAR